jgi:outer membrane protein OmpA-like peptidoglycan-associated protein
LCFVLVSLVCANFRSPCFAGDLPEWTGGVFLDLGAQYYLVPDIAGTFDLSMAERYGVSGGLIKPWPGFRAGAGYQWKNLRLSLEAGYTRIEGDNPLVLDIGVIPLFLKGGYVFSPLDRLTITPLLGAGVVFAGVDHYETAIAMLLDEASHSSNRGFFANAALRLGWSFIPALTLYAGAGVDCLIETGGIIPLPALEMGITLKPFLFRRKPPAGGVVPARTVPEDIPALPALKPETGTEEEPAVFMEEPEPVPIPDLILEPPPHILTTLYFPADAAAPSQLTELDEAAELLLAMPGLNVTLRGYTAPYSTPGARRALSEVRARFCADYLIREYGIPEERITVEWYGSEQLPEAGGSDQQRRCVEIIIEPGLVRQPGQF